MGEVRNSRPSNTSGLACPESIRICTHVHSRYSLKWTCLAVWFCAALRIPSSTLLLSSPIPVPGQFLRCEQFFVLLMAKSVISFHMHSDIDYYYWRLYVGYNMGMRQVEETRKRRYVLLFGLRLDPLFHAQRDVLARRHWSTFFIATPLPAAICAENVSLERVDPHIRLETSFPRESPVGPC